MPAFAIRRREARLAGFLVSPKPRTDARGLRQFPQSSVLGPQATHRELQMSNYTVEELIARWKREELTVEQVIGQILLVLKDQEQRLREAARSPSGGSQPSEPEQRRR